MDYGPVVGSNTIHPYGPRRWPMLLAGYIKRRRGSLTTITAVFSMMRLTTGVHKLLFNKWAFGPFPCRLRRCTPTLKQPTGFTVSRRRCFSHYLDSPCAAVAAPFF